MRFEALKVGELALARRTGLTVRALHHYDEIGLLRPSLHTDAGHRLYTAADVARLQQVVSLRQLGFTLEEVRGCLDRPDFSPRQILRLHVARLQEQIRRQHELCERLQAIAARLDAAGEVSADEFLHTIEGMTTMEKYFTPQQADLIAARRAEAGPEQLQQAQAEWAELIAELRAALDAGTDPADAQVQALARRWTALLAATTGGDSEIEQSLQRLWEEQGDALAAQYGSEYDSRPVWDYVNRALAAMKGTA